MAARKAQKCECGISLPTHLAGLLPRNKPKLVHICLCKRAYKESGPGKFTPMLAPVPDVHTSRKMAKPKTAPKPRAKKQVPSSQYSPVTYVCSAWDSMTQEWATGVLKLPSDLRSEEVELLFRDGIPTQREASQRLRKRPGGEDAWIVTRDTKLNMRTRILMIKSRDHQTDGINILYEE